ncbi:WD40 repeat domain-containing protein [Ferruginibacter sp.]|nr:hypothetical protein [Ferruginibacter sp.]
MKKNSPIIIILTMFISVIELKAQKNELFISKMTAVNPVSYTDVIFIGEKDTVLVSTYSGRISKIIKGKQKEKVISQLGDEIYLLSYNSTKKHIAASTLENGIVIVSEINGKVIRKLPLIQTWSLRMGYSGDSKLLFANDQRGNRFIWDATNNYSPVSLPPTFPEGIIYSIEKNVITLISAKKITKWDHKTQIAIQEIPNSVTRIVDIDSSNNILSIDFNVCKLYSSNENKELFTFKHPSWLRSAESIGGEDAARTYGIEIKDGYFEDTDYQMALTSAKFGRDKVFTSSIDRSIRIWDKYTGQLLMAITGHKGTVNKIKVSPDKLQLVSIDLKGGIQFTQI